MSSSRNNQSDARGVPVSRCDPQSLADFEKALREFQSYFGDPAETLATTLERDPEFVLGHIFMANAMLLMSERQYLPMVKASVEKAEALHDKSNDREKLLVKAARQWMEGSWDSAAQTWDQVLVANPTDAMALQCGHLTDFYLGNATNLRDRVGRVINSWDSAMPGYSFVLGMQAFGFEESNQFDRAEDTARAALAIEKRDGWTVHALAHVLEMQNRYEEGQQFMRDNHDNWAPDNGFAFHNWWHLCLFYMEQEDYSTALDLYDKQILPTESDVSLQMLDASAMLWRLHLQGVDVGDRWLDLATMWRAKTDTENGYYAFNDLHAVFAMVGAGRLDQARTVLQAVESAAVSNTPLTAMMARDVGVPACAAAIAFGEGRYADVVAQLLPIRTSAHRFGGSNAQRDVLTQTLIESAIRDGQSALAANLLGERAVHKPFSPLTQRFKAKVASAAVN